MDFRILSSNHPKRKRLPGTRRYLDGGYCIALLRELIFKLRITFLDYQVQEDAWREAQWPQTELLSSHTTLPMYIGRK